MKVGRDSLIESAVGDVFPRLTASDRATVRRAICLSIDGNLNQEVWTQSTARDELILALRGQDANAAAAAQVADFVGQVLAARQP